MSNTDRRGVQDSVQDVEAIILEWKTIERLLFCKRRNGMRQKGKRSLRTLIKKQKCYTVVLQNFELCVGPTREQNWGLWIKNTRNPVGLTTRKKKNPPDISVDPKQDTLLPCLLPHSIYCTLMTRVGLGALGKSPILQPVRCLAPIGGRVYVELN